MAIKFFAFFFPTISTFGCFWSQWPTSLAVTMRCGRLPSRSDVNIIIAIITGILLFMAFDLKVFVRSFNCESCACCVGNPRESFAKVGYFESLSLFTLQLVKGYHLLPPAARGPAGEWYRTIGSSQASEGEPNTMVCRWYCLTLLSEVSRNKLQMQRQASKSEALQEPNTKAPGVCFSSDACILKGVAQ